MCSSLITDQLITAVGYRCKVRKHGIHAKQSLLYNEKCKAEIIIFAGYCDIKRPGGSGRVFSGSVIWPKYSAEIGKTVNIVTRSGIWLLPGKWDSPKCGHGMRDFFRPVCWEFGRLSRPKYCKCSSCQSRWCVLSNHTIECPGWYLSNWNCQRVFCFNKMSEKSTFDHIYCNPEGTF